MMNEKGNYMLQVKVGDVIRGYDFKPMVGRNDCFVEGTVIETNNTENYFQAYKIEVTKDVFDGQEQPAGEASRLGKIVFVPYRVDFMEYPGRVMNLSA
jgi:hypothetical protein